MINTESIKYLLNILKESEKKDYDPKTLPKYIDAATDELVVLITRIRELEQIERIYQKMLKIEIGLD